MSNLSLSKIQYLCHKTQILNNVTFDINKSELVCLVGPSGSGKTTLLRLIAGFEKLNSGEIRLNNKIISSSKTHIAVQKRNIGMVFQQPSLFSHLNVRQNIAFGLHKYHKEEREEIVNDLLNLIDLKKYENSYPHNLSGGQQQRVAIARSLAPRPEIILLDEPFANLDNKLRRQMALEIVEILKTSNIGILMVTHDPEESLIFADKMVLLNSNGGICQIGSPSQIHNHPIDINSAGFFGTINIFPAIIQGNYIESKIGKLATKDYLPNGKNNAKISIVTRLEGLRITKNSGTKAIVTRVIHSGAGSIITAILDNMEINFHHIYGSTPNVGDEVNISFEPPHIFVFED
jgi:iron(III) transport system ATP-binding protein